MTTDVLTEELNATTLCGLPAQRRWTGPDGAQPLPLRTLRPHVHVVARSPDHATTGIPAVLAPGWLPFPHALEQPFDFTFHMQRLCTDIVSRCEVFHHIEMDRILLGAAQTRSRRRAGLQARVTPMRFREGRLTRRRRNWMYQVQQYFVDGVEVLYVMTFLLPRFMDQSFDDKFVTIFHELYHIAPEFNGDLRRHGGRYCMHTHSQKGYDRRMAALAREYLTNGADPDLHAFLRLGFQDLHDRHGKIVAQFVPVPKLLPCGM